MRRIVARVDQLMALYDELEAKLRQSKTDGEKLMAAVVGELVGGNLKCGIGSYLSSP